MKRGIELKRKVCFSFIGLLLLATGCSQAEGKEPVFASFHSQMALDHHGAKAPVVLDVLLMNELSGENEKIRLNDYGYWPGRELDTGALADLAGGFAEAIDTPMKNPRLMTDGTFLPGEPRVILSEQEFVEKLSSIAPLEADVVMPIYLTEPNVTEEELKEMKTEEIASFTTYFDSSVAGRTENIRLSADAIHGTVLGPGDTFSFNHEVGERTVERGYKEAKEIVNKEFVMGIGGGICQTSSTLFNAVDQAGLSIVERFTHSREIGYVPTGRDATVSWGGPDFRFSNPFDKPIWIQTSVEGGAITVSVYVFTS